MNKNAQLILEIIQSSDEHMTAEQIYKKLTADSPRMSLATVYNNLAQLYESGQIRKVSSEGYPDRYDKTVRHDHLICRKCGKLTDILLKDLTDLLQSQIDEELLSYDLKISHLCPSCQYIGGRP